MSTFIHFLLLGAFPGFEISDSLKILLAAMTPIGELRLSIPLGIITLDMVWYKVLLLSIAGNIVPVPILLVTIDRINNFLQAHPSMLTKFLNWRTNNIRKYYSPRLERYGLAFLVVLVAIPLPFTGAWTGSVAAWVFHIPKRKAIPLIGLGIILSGSIVTLITISGTNIGSR